MFRKAFLDFLSFSIVGRHTQVAHAVAGAHACNATIEWTKIPYIPVVNSPKMVSMLETVAKRFGQYGQWERMTEPLMVGEDFAFLAGKHAHKSLSIMQVVAKLAEAFIYSLTSSS